jgi:hypothetical protein
MGLHNVGLADRRVCWGIRLYPHKFEEEEKPDGTDIILTNIKIFFRK